MSNTRWRTFPTSNPCLMARRYRVPIRVPIPATITAMEKTLRGQLLIAAPSLFDYFRRTVVLVIEHTEEGAMGVVLNRPSETTVAEAVSALAELADENELVRVGGPVSPEAVVV